jgi:tetratricopeptide (TPR) repeat protein
MQRQRRWFWPTAWRGLLTFSFLFVLGAALGLCQETFMVEGQVVTDRGSPVPTQVHLRLETVDGQLVADQPADSRGLFRFINIDRRAYRLTVTANGFQAVQQWLDVRRGMARYLITINMSPVEKRMPGDETISVTELSAPKKARKEYEKGNRAFQKGDLPEARGHLEKAVSLYPCYARAQTTLGMTLELQSELSAAESTLRKAIKCDAGFLPAHIQLAILLNHEKRFAESEADLKKAQAHFPGAWQLSYQLAAAHYGLGRYGEAEREYLKAESLNTEVPAEIHVRLADIYTQQGAYGKAYGEMQMYLRVEPKGRFAAKVTEVMHRMETAGVSRSARTQPPSSTPTKN